MDPPWIVDFSLRIFINSRLNAGEFCVESSQPETRRSPNADIEIRGLGTVLTPRIYVFEVVDYDRGLWVGFDVLYLNVAVIFRPPT